MTQAKQNARPLGSKPGALPKHKQADSTGFDRARLPDPLDYFTGTAGLKFRERKGRWRTTSCAWCGSSDATRVNTESGAFVCMTGCGARGGDVLAYEMARSGLGFVDAAKALGAWTDGGKPAPTRPTPLPARDALQLLAAEANVAAIAASNVAHGVALTSIDLERLLQAAGRINTIREFFK